MVIVPIDYPTRDRLEKDWHSDYVVHSYPFFMWVNMKYRGRMVWKIENHPFGLEFKTQEDANSFIKTFDITCDIITVGTNVKDLTTIPTITSGVKTRSGSRATVDGSTSGHLISFISKMKKMLCGMN